MNVYNDILISLSLCLWEFKNKYHKYTQNQTHHHLPHQQTTHSKLKQVPATTTLISTRSWPINPLPPRRRRNRKKVSNKKNRLSNRSTTVGRKAHAENVVRKTNWVKITNKRGCVNYNWSKHGPEESKDKHLWLWQVSRSALPRLVGVGHLTFKVCEKSRILRLTLYWLDGRAIPT